MAPLDRLARRLAAGEALVAGVLSGTSADGIDVALVRPAPASAPARAPHVLAFATEPFPAELGARVRAVLDGSPCGLGAAALLHRDLGRAFGAAAARVARRRADVERGVERGLELVGSHGQTVWHHDGREPSGPATLQLGDGDFVARAAGCTVVSDFRQADVAAGGEGAPLVALVDAALYPALPRPAAVLNLGGMANLTLLSERGLESAFDVGPCGSLLDGLARRVLDAPFDADGAAALAGRVDEATVAWLAAHPFLAAPPPKSTGRDTFGAAWVDALCARAAALAPADLCASAAAFVAASVADALERFAPAPPRALVVAGGGARNRALVRALAERVPAPVSASDEHGVDADAREAVGFALLAAACVRGEALDARAATGARVPAILGKISRFAGAEEAAEAEGAA